MESVFQNIAPPTGINREVFALGIRARHTLKFIGVNA
jgi:hypothetical protein